MLTGLRHRSVIGADNKDRAVHLGCARNHVFDIVRMSGTIGLNNQVSWRTIWALVAILICTVMGSVHAEAPTAGEYQIKAAMLFNMAKFVDWPADSFAKPDSPLTVCVMGGGPFGAALESFKGKPVKGHPLSIRRVSVGDELGACQILAASEVDKRNLAALLSAGRKKGILTVSDAAKFAQVGGTVGFVEIDGKVRFEINLDSAEKAQIKISSQLLKLAKIVWDGGK